jgi:hypothetical protein
MSVDLPPNVDLEQHLQAGTALQGNYFYETTVNVDNRVEKAVEKFRDNLRVEMHEHGRYTIVVVNEPEAIRYSPEQSKTESYISYIKDQTIETHMQWGLNQHESNILSNKQLESLNHTRSQHYKLAGINLPDKVDYMTKMASDAIATNQSSSAHMSYRNSPVITDAHDVITNSSEKSFGYINYDFHADKNIYEKHTFQKMTTNPKSVKIEGFTLESSTEKTLNHELGHHLSHFHSKHPFTTHGSETMADILEIAYSAADGTVTQEEVDLRILQRSYAFAQGDSDHYSVSSIKNFLNVTDLNQFTSLTKDEITQNVLERQDDYMFSQKKSYQQYDLNTLKETGTAKVNLTSGNDAKVSVLEGLRQFYFVNEHKNNYESDLPQETFSPKQANLLMKNKDFLDFAQSEDMDLNIIKDIADRAYLITTEEDIALGLDQKNYEKPHIFYSNTPEIPSDILEESTYPYNLSIEHQKDMSENEIAYATYYNKMTSDIWRDVDTLEPHDLSIHQRTHIFKKYTREVTQENYKPPKNLTLEDVKSIHLTHESALEYHQNVELEEPLILLQVGPQEPTQSR